MEPKSRQYWMCLALNDSVLTPEIDLKYSIRTLIYSVYIISHYFNEIYIHYVSTNAHFIVFNYNLLYL